MLNDIIKFKVHVQKNLEDYEGFVVDEVEHDLAGDDTARDDTQDVDVNWEPDLVVERVGIFKKSLVWRLECGMSSAAHWMVPT